MRLIPFLLRRKKAAVKHPEPLGRFFVERVKFFNSGRRAYFN